MMNHAIRLVHFLCSPFCLLYVLVAKLGIWMWCVCEIGEGGDKGESARGVLQELDY